ncbi:MAG: endo-1,3-alpha-glucanase family glycosylhydrolase [Chthonomonadales bacterium]
MELKYKAVGSSPMKLALYEAWFGLPSHIAVGYSSKDPENIRSQIDHAKRLGIAGFVVDWYGNREPFIDQSYEVLQKVASKNKFQVAMMYDESDTEEGATDLVLADLTYFHERYLLSNSPGHEAYLTYEGRPVIFVFPHGHHTDWAQVRAAVNKWSSPPWLIQENLPGPHPEAFDGFYPWINPGPDGWASDGRNWGDRYLKDFYKNMAERYSDKIVVGGVWPGFDDSKASWSLNRRISDRCGQTYREGMDLWKQYFPAGQVIPFMLIQTWNDYEEGSQIETGIPSCPTAPAPKL